MSWCSEALQAPLRGLCWIGGRPAGETARPTEQAPVSTACGVLWLPALACWTGLAAGAFAGADALSRGALGVGGAVALLAWWLDRLLLGAEETATTSRRSAAWAARGVLAGSAALLAWQLLPVWHQAAIEQHRQVLRSQTAEAAIDAVARRQESRLADGADAAAGAPSVKARRDLAQCMRQAGYLREALPSNEASPLYASRRLAWRLRSDACERLAAEVAALPRAAPAPDPQVPAARRAEAERLRDRAQRAADDAERTLSTLRHQRDACRWAPPDCALQQAEAAGFVPRWQRWGWPLFAALLVGLPWLLRSLHPAEPAAAARRDRARVELAMNQRREAMLRGIGRGRPTTPAQ